MDKISFFYIEKSVLCNYADDRTLYTANTSVSVLTINVPIPDRKKLKFLFQYNFLKSENGKIIDNR